MHRALAVAALVALCCATQPDGFWAKKGAASNPDERAQAMGKCRVASNTVAAGCGGDWVSCTVLQNDTFAACMQGEGWYWSRY